MIKHHTAIFVSSEEGVAFYKELGFVEESRINDSIVWLSGFGERLEVFIDGARPARVTEPEALGLSHIAFEVDDIEAEWARLQRYKPDPIRKRMDGNLCERPRWFADRNKGLRA